VATMTRVTAEGRGTGRFARGGPRKIGCRRVALDGLALAAATLAREAPTTLTETGARTAGRFGAGVDSEPRAPDSGPPRFLRPEA
jgi:hypothetical protein